MNSTFGAEFDQGQIPTIACVNKSTVDLGIDFSRLIQALQLAISKYFQPVCSIPNLTISTEVLSNTWNMLYIDNPDISGALGYHDLSPTGEPLLHIFTKLILDHGGSIPETASHELMESLVNPSLSKGYLYSDGHSWVGAEVADAVEKLTWEMSEFPGIPISNFVFPSYFETFRKPESCKMDYLGQVKHSYEVLPMGYLPICRNGSWLNIFAEEDTKAAYKPELHPRIIKLNKGHKNWKLSKPILQEN